MLAIPNQSNDQQKKSFATIQKLFIYLFPHQYFNGFKLQNSKIFILHAKMYSNYQKKRSLVILSSSFVFSFSYFSLKFCDYLKFECLINKKQIASLSIDEDEENVGIFFQSSLIYFFKFPFLFE